MYFDYALVIFGIGTVYLVGLVLHYSLRPRAPWHFTLRQAVTLPVRAARKIIANRNDWTKRINPLHRMRKLEEMLQTLRDDFCTLEDKGATLQRVLQNAKKNLAHLETWAPSVMTWTPQCPVDGVVLTGAVSGCTMAERAHFETRTKPDGVLETTDALLVSHKDGIRVFRGECRGLKPGSTYDVQLICRSGEMRLRGQCVTFTVPDFAKPRATTTSATVRGRTLESVNGTVLSSNLPTTYHFEYGNSESDLRYTTAKRAVGERVGARWKHYEYLHKDSAVGSTVSRQVSNPLSGNSFVRYSPQDPRYQALDGNHPRVGTILLVKYLSTGRNEGDDGIMLGGGMADLRDAVIRTKIRGVEWCGNGASVCFWFQRSFDDSLLVDEKQKNDKKLHVSIWCFTSQPLNEYLEDGEWHDVELRLTCDSSLWSFGGSVKFMDLAHHAFAPDLRRESNFTWAPLRPKKSNYDYSPINDSLKDNNSTMILVVNFADKSNLPHGSIDMEWLDVTYRNNTILAPQRGTRLISWPSSSVCDPMSLADPGQNRIGSGWHGPVSASEPIEFMYEFSKLAELAMVQLFQHADWPAREVEVLWADDEQDFESLGTVVMPGPECGLDSHAIVRTQEREVRFLKVVLHSGYSESRAGLRGLDVFGHLDTSFPDSGVSTISEDIAVDPSHKELWYRLVAENSKGISNGEIRSLLLPADGLPRIEDVAIRSVGHRSTAFTVSVNPMGHPTMATVHYETTTGSSGKSKTYYAGDNESHVHLLIEIEHEPERSLERVWVVARYPDGEVTSDPVRVRG